MPSRRLTKPTPRAWSSSSRASKPLAVLPRRSRPDDACQTAWLGMGGSDPVVEAALDICSAALYFPPSSAGSVPRSWLGRILELAERNKLSFDLADVTGQGFSEGQTAKWPEICDAVSIALEKREVSRLDLYATLPSYKQLIFGWHGLFSLDFARGVFYLGIDCGHVSSLAELLLNAFTLAKEVLDIRYGYSYKRSLKLGPFLYAVGLIAGLDYGRKDEAERNSITGWGEELREGKRYLANVFRGAFPANI